jgi:hypothetical protein
VNKASFLELVIVLALGWMAVIARITSSGLDSGTLWVAGFAIALTLSLVLIRRLPGGTPGQKRPAWAVKLVESRLGKVVIALLSMALMVGAGSAIGVLVCVPTQSPAETIFGLPEILGTAIVGAAMSVIGFGLFAILLSLLGPVLSVAFEGWIEYIAPVVGGVVGAATAGGYVSGGIAIVGISALAGALALLVFEVSTRRKRVRIKDVGDSLAAGLGFGFVHGLILALLSPVVLDGLLEVRRWK